MTADPDRRHPVRHPIGFSRVNAVLFTLLGLGPRFSHVDVGDDTVEIRMGWGFRADIPRGNVRSVAAAERPLIGWGVHGWRGRWLVNGSSKGIVALELDPPVRARVVSVPVRLRTAYISLADRERFLQALATP